MVWIWNYWGPLRVINMFKIYKNNSSSSRRHAEITIIYMKTSTTITAHVQPYCYCTLIRTDVYFLASQAGYIIPIGYMAQCLCALKYFANEIWNLFLFSLPRSFSLLPRSLVQVIKTYFSVWLLCSAHHLERPDIKLIPMSIPKKCLNDFPILQMGANVMRIICSLLIFLVRDAEIWSR